MKQKGVVFVNSRGPQPYRAFHLHNSRRETLVRGTGYQWNKYNSTHYDYDNPRRAAWACLYTIICVPCFAFHDLPITIIIVLIHHAAVAPPPKVVMGYKFNIFYPGAAHLGGPLVSPPPSAADLVDPSRQQPTYFVEPTEKVRAGNRKFANGWDDP